MKIIIVFRLPVNLELKLKLSVAETKETAGRVAYHFSLKTAAPVVFWTRGDPVIDLLQASEWTKVLSSTGVSRLFK